MSEYRVETGKDTGSLTVDVCVYTLFTDRGAFCGCLLRPSGVGHGFWMKTVGGCKETCHEQQTLKKVKQNRAARPDAHPCTHTLATFCFFANYCVGRV